MKTTYRNLCALALAAGVSASVASAAVTIDWVTVGNPGNPADSTGYGAVAYEYQIARNETTIGQYAAFLAAKAQSDNYGLYNTSMASSTYLGSLITRGGASGNYSYTVASGRENLPVAYVSWFDAARFCNWLHNGQGNGSTETGAYTLNGAMSGFITKNADARFWIPTEDEWYKAAYYDPTKGGTGGYWLHANQSNSLAGNTIGNANSANYYDGDFVGSGTSSFPSGNALTDVGAYGSNSDSFYGTNDQGGNIREWNDAVIGSSRGLRGGSWNYSENILRSSFLNSYIPSLEAYSIGFRVASVPEPSAMVLTMLFGAALCTRRKR
jgi:formylglycine-generating enzyme required for sulfatase activity